MLRCGDGSIYTGITTDMERRLMEHKSGKSKAAKYTRVHDVCKVAALWKSSDRSRASKLEYRIKSLSKRQKEKLVCDGDLSVIKDKINVEDYERISFGE